MKKIILVFTSMSGNTEMLAEAIGNGVSDIGISIVVKEAYEVLPNEIQNYDGLLFGSYTWGDGELPDELLDLCEELEGSNFSKMKSAVFGSCSSLYEHYGRAVDILTERLIEWGAELVNEPLKIEQTPDANDLEICREFGRSFARAILDS